MRQYTVRWAVLITAWIAVIVGIALMPAVSSRTWHLALGAAVVGGLIAVVVPRVWRR